VKRHLDPFTFEDLRFRPLTEADLPMTLRWRNQPRVRSMLFHSEPLRMETHREWFEAYRDRDDDFIFVVEASSPFDRPIGQVSVYNIEWEEGRAEVGRLMVGEDDALWRGFGRMMVEGLSRYALGPLGLRELHARVKACNGASIRSFLASGYTLENPGEDPVLLIHRGFGVPTETGAC